MVRPTTWPDRLAAPKEALELYRVIAKLQGSDAFKECHVYDGSSLRTIPQVKWQGKATSLPKIVAAFFGLAYGAKTCQTRGCMNPFHHTAGFGAAPNHELITQPIADPVQGTSVMVDQVELVEFYMERHEVEKDFHALRDVISEEDMSDSLLFATLEHMGNIQ
jgi:hypothetical protein